MPAASLKFEHAQQRGGVLPSPALCHQRIELLPDPPRCANRQRYAEPRRPRPEQARSPCDAAAPRRRPEIASTHAPAETSSTRAAGRSADQPPTHLAGSARRRGQTEGLGDGLIAAHHDHLIAGLGHLPGAVRANVDNRPPKHLKHRPQRSSTPPCRRPHRQCGPEGARPPPETGASSIETPCSPSLPAIRRASPGAMVEQSTSTESGTMPSISPLAPRATSSTSALEVMIVNTTAQ